MKINLIDYIKKVGDTTSLSTVEQEKLERVLTEYMAMKPIRGAHSSKDERHAETKGSFFSSLFMHSKRRYVPVAIVLGLLLSGTASYAAEGALPGDLLYPIKVGVNEKVERALAVSTESKATLEAKFAGRRLSDSTNLAVGNKLTEDNSAKLSSDFAKHADAAVAETEKLEKKDASVAIGLASNFESNLVAHEALLAGVNAKGKTDTLRAVVRTKALLVSKFRMNAEGDAEVSARSVQSIDARKATGISESVTVDARIKQETAVAVGNKAKASIKEAQSLLAKASRKLDTSTLANAKVQITLATTLSTEGDTLVKSGDFVGAFHSYQDALVAVSKLTVYLNASGGVNIKLFAPSEDSSSVKNNNNSKSHGSDREEDGNSAPDPTEILPIDINVNNGVDVQGEVHVGGSNVNVGGSGTGSVNIGL